MDMKKKEAIIGLFNKINTEKTNSNEYVTLLKEFNILREKFDKQLCKDPKKDLQRLIDLTKDMSVIEKQEFFIEGFSLAGLSTLFQTIFIRTLFYMQLVLNNLENHVF